MDDWDGPDLTPLVVATDHHAARRRFDQRREQRRRRRRLRLRAGLLAAGMALAAFAGRLALLEDRAAVTTDNPPSPSTENRSGEGVSDSRGRYRGVMVGDTVKLPGGFEGRRVIDDTGKSVGYMVNGQIGFIDTAHAANGDFLLRLNDCYEQYTATLQADSDCTELLAEEGVDTTP